MEYFSGITPGLADPRSEVSGIDEPGIFRGIIIHSPTKNVIAQSGQLHDFQYRLAPLLTCRQH